MEIYPSQLRVMSVDPYIAAHQYYIIALYEKSETSWEAKQIIEYIFITNLKCLVEQKKR